jgi:hypothetical protein
MEGSSRNSANFQALLGPPASSLENLQFTLFQLGLPYAVEAKASHPVTITQVRKALAKAQIGYHQIDVHAFTEQQESEGTSYATTVTDSFGQLYNVEWVFSPPGLLVRFEAEVVSA